MRTNVPRKVKIPKRLKGWELYDTAGASAQNARLVYGHESGLWAVVRPVGGGPTVMVYSTDGTAPDDAQEYLDLLLKYVTKGTGGIRIDVQDTVVEGDIQDAYDDAGIR